MWKQPHITRQTIEEMEVEDDNQNANQTPQTDDILCTNTQKEVIGTEQPERGNQTQDVNKPPQTRGRTRKQRVMQKDTTTDDTTFTTSSEGHEDTIHITRVDGVKIKSGTITNQPGLTQVKSDDFPALITMTGTDITKTKLQIHRMKKPKTDMLKKEGNNTPKTTSRSSGETESPKQQ
jgi:hypothetical protein